MLSRMNRSTGLARMTQHGYRGEVPPPLNICRCNVCMHVYMGSNDCKTKRARVDIQQVAVKVHNPVPYPCTSYSGV